MSQPQIGTLDFMVRMKPKDLAIIDGEVRLPWDAWDERACRLASYLRDRLGLSRGDRVAWMLPNSRYYYDLWFAAQKLGLSPVSVPYRLTGAEAAYIIDHSDAKALVLDAALAPRLAAARAELTKLRDEAFLLAGDVSLAQGALPHATSLEQALLEGDATRFFADQPPTRGAMVYTSGTTGKPKGAVRDFAGRDPSELRNYQRGMTMALGFMPGAPDVHLLTCPLYHSAPPVFANMSHVMGGRVVIMRKFDPEEALSTIAREKVTSTFMVPTLLRRIVSLPEEVRNKYDLSSMQRLITGGAPCPIDLKEKVIATFPRPCLYEFYGSTETALVTVIKPDEHLKKPGSCGRPVPGAEAKVLGEDGQEVDAGQRGALWVKNPMVVVGYHKNDEATREAVRDGFFCVGDVAVRDEDGFFYIVDRKNDMIISGGVNIYPAEIEHEIRKHPAVYDCGVFGVPNEEWGEEVKAVVQLKPGSSLDEATLKAFLEDKLAGFKRPRSIDFMDELPYSPTGKLLKKELRAPYWDEAGRAI
jgi:fatty-acyl-CoA synthase/long-chain acyl-CoA synthetase